MLTELEVKKLEVWVGKFFTDKQKDKQNFDIKAEVDKSLTFSENKNILREKIKTLIGDNIDKMKKSEAEIMPKEQFEIKLQTIKKEQESQAKLEFENVLRKIESDKTTNILEQIYYVPKQFAKMVAQGHAKGFLLYGICGTGKTYCVMRAFREVGKPFTLLSGHITQLELFRFLYHHRKENIIFDDVNLFESKTNLNMLKACMNDNNRVVTYSSSSSKLEKLNIPSSFLFEGTIILLVNSKSRSNRDLQAVESRMLSHELKFDYPTIIKVLFELVKSEYKSLTFEERLTIAKWIKENTNQSTQNFNLRTLFHIYEMYLYDKNEWKNLAKRVLINDEQLELVIQCINRNSTIKAAEQDFCNITQYSGRYFYKLKARIV
jgi:hypothetical protein